jgi:hypothetical protein
LLDAHANAGTALEIAQQFADHLPFASHRPETDGGIGFA